MEGIILDQRKQTAALWRSVCLIALSYFLIECLGALLTGAKDPMVLIFGGLWTVLLTALVTALPRLAGRILYGISYYVVLIWMMAQTGYYELFRKMMWLSDIFFAGEGADYLGSVLAGFPALWWIGSILLLGLGGAVIWQMPKRKVSLKPILTCTVAAAAAVVGLFVAPQVLFERDDDIWGTHSEYAQSSSYRAAYTTMYDAKNVYDICGIYQMTFRDVWKHNLYPLTPAYRLEQQKNIKQIKAYFDQRPSASGNEMTGILEGKNVILVLMESMDDWMVTPEHTPTIYNLINAGINFTHFYTPGYGGARTINSEFCVNSGIYLPTTGKYVFDYVTNGFNQSMASQLVDQGYSAEVFHYNSPDFYSRGVFEPALGYNAYNSYEPYIENDRDLFNESFMFDNGELRELFFRDGKTFNFVITRSAHLSYVYNEVLSNYALRQYPEYRDMFGHEETDCAMVKARLVDDFFARLLEELKTQGQLEDTVIIGVTDHYTYGYKDTENLLALSGVTDELELERTPCFIWSADGPNLDVDKTMNTADLLPTVLNLLGVDSPFTYLGQDAFDPNYEGYAMFPNGSWISDGVICNPDSNGEPVIITNEKEKQLTEDYLLEMARRNQEFVNISNLLLITDYYKTVQ